MNLKRSDDASLLRLIADEYTDALEELYERYNRLVFSVSLTMLADRAVAEEVTLDVFVRVWRAAHTYQPDRAKVSTWLVAITRHHAIDVLRSQRSHPATIKLEPIERLAENDSASADPEDNAETSLQRKQIRKAIAQLPSEQRQVLILASFKGYTHQQIAEALEQPLGTIKTRIRLAMQKLRQIILKEDQPNDKSRNDSSTYPINKKD